MLLKQILTPGLGCMTYLVGDEEAGEAVVVDPVHPARDAEREADAAGLRITHALDTHLHADHLSGARALAERTGADVHLPAGAAARYPHEPLADGDALRVGRVLLRVRDAPGHTPEHVVVEVHDMARADGTPYAVLTGDALFAGSVGRPDLVQTTDADTLARDLHATLRGLLARIPDGALVFPGHGAGSACGARLGDLPASSIGYERASNAYLAEADPDAFAARLTRDLPPPPGNAANLKRLNRDGPPGDGLDPAPALDPDAFEEAARGGRALVLDAREPDAYAAGHVPSSVNAPASPKAFPARAALLLEWDFPLLLVVPGGEDVARVREALARVGGLHVDGVLSGGIDAWRSAGKPAETLGTVGPHEARAALASDEARLLDVRSGDEWRDGHVEGAHHRPWESVVRGDHAGIDRDATWIVACGSGYRSAVAASVLARAGYPRVLNLLGGMGAWEAAGIPTTRGVEAPLAP